MIDVFSWFANKQTALSWYEYSEDSFEKLHVGIEGKVLVITRRDPS